MEMQMPQVNTAEGFDGRRTAWVRGAGAVLLLVLAGVPTLRGQQAAATAVEQLPHPHLLGTPRTAEPEFGAPAMQAAPVLQTDAVPPIPQPYGSTPTVAPIAFRTAPSASDGAPDVYGNYGAYLALSGDFGHTNHLDVVVFQGDSTLNYMSNDGKGNFTKSYVTVNPTYAAVSSGQVADVNGDGYLDIVLANSSPVGFTVLLNNGNGTFAAPKFYALPAQSGPGVRLTGTYVNLADLNHDGKLDVVASAYMYNQSGSAQAGTLYNMSFFGNGDGTFQSPIVGATAYTSSATGLRGVVLADMNNDGKTDAVAAIWIYNSVTGFYSVYLSVGLGDGAGHFGSFGPATATNTVAGSYYADAVMVAMDVNGDGKQDVLWTDRLGTLYVSTGNGDGTLQAPNVTISSSSNIGSFTLGDYNRDGYLDIAVFVDGLVSIYAGQGNGSFSTTALSRYASELAGSQPTLAQDFDGDGTPDLIIVGPFRNQLAFLKGYGDGTFLAAPLVVPQNVSSVQPNNTDYPLAINVDAAGNWNGDGKSGLLAEEISGGSDYLDYALQNGKGGFNFTRIFNLSQTSNVTGIEPITADFNKDGRDDFILTLTTGIGLGLSNGDGTITRTRATFPVTFACGLSYAATGDINNDGNLDMVVAYEGDANCSQSSTVRSGFFVLLGDGTGNFTTTYTAFGSSLYTVKLADLNRDGKLDLVLDDVSSGLPAISVIPGDGSGVFKTGSAKRILSGGGTQNAMLLDDFNGDGIPDLTVLQSGISGATGNTQKGILTMAGNGDFTFQPPQFLVRGVTGISEVYTDFNQDKLPDLVVNVGVGGIVLGGVAVFPNLGNGTFGAPVLLQTPATSGGQTTSLVLAGDFNGDTAPDIVAGSGNGYVPNVFFANAAGSQLVLVAESSTTTQYNPISLSAAALPVGSQQPTGTVSFFSNGTLLNSSPLVNGIANLSTAALTLGTDTITAKYSGDSADYPSTSNSVTVTVTALAPNFAMSGSTSQLTVTTATPGQMALTLVANQTFQGSATFACQGLPASVTCAFAGSPLTLAAGATATQQVVVTYNPQLAEMKRAGRFPADGVAVAGLLGLLMMVRRRKGSRLVALAILLCAAGLTGLGGCSSSSGNGATKTPFTANFNIVATGTTGTTTVVRSVPVAVNVTP
jgi:hypothetical protein